MPETLSSEAQELEAKRMELKSLLEAGRLHEFGTEEDIEKGQKLQQEINRLERLLKGRR